MNVSDPTLRALDALRRADRDREAPLQVEERLLVAFHAKRDQTRRRAERNVSWAWFAATAAALLVFLTLRESKYGVETVHVQAPVRSPKETRVATTAPSPLPFLSATAPAPVRRDIATRRAQPPVELVTDFFPLMDAPPPLGRGRLLRVAVPASAMRSVGLPVREEFLNRPVEADILVGEEGMARAIRFVSERNQ